MSIYIPQKVRVWYQERTDTYSWKLWYVIYYDEKWTLRKENSWRWWIKHDLWDFENVPTEWFVLNKKVWWDSWSGRNHRNTYTRVYDPRWFEFEISIENLLFILENTSSIKWKWLEWEFVYSFDWKDLVLLPVDSVDYKEIKQKSDLINNNNFLSPKDLIIWNKYRIKSGEIITYLGKRDYFHYWRNSTPVNNYKNYDYNVDDIESTTKYFIYWQYKDNYSTKYYIDKKSSFSKYILEDLWSDPEYIKYNILLNKLPNFNKSKERQLKLLDIDTLKWLLIWVVNKSYRLDYLCKKGKNYDYAHWFREFCENINNKTDSEIQEVINKYECWYYEYLLENNEISVPTFYEIDENFYFKDL